MNLFHNLTHSFTEWYFIEVQKSLVFYLYKSRCLANSLIQLPLSFTLGARGFSCAVSGFGQVLKSDPREKLRRSCLRASAEHVSACGRRNEAPRRTREKTSGTQGTYLSTSSFNNASCTLLSIPRPVSTSLGLG